MSKENKSYVGGEEIKQEDFFNDHPGIWVPALCIIAFVAMIVLMKSQTN